MTLSSSTVRALALRCGSGLILIRNLDSRDAVVGARYHKNAARTIRNLLSARASERSYFPKFVC